MEPEVREWLDHLEELVMSLACVLKDYRRHSDDERAIETAITRYFNQMENL
jgi:hypothetical protein